MWIILQLLGAFFICIINIALSKYGLSVKGVGIFLFFVIFFNSWILPLSFQLAPTFFQPYFLGLGSLTILGLLSSYLFFTESFNLFNIIGLLLMGLGCIFITL